MNLFVESTEQSFNLGTIVRRFYWSPLQIDAVFLAGPSQDVPTKLFAIINMDTLHHPPAWPAGREAQPVKTLLLRQNRMRDAQTDRHDVRWVQRDVNTDYHATEYINCQRYP